MKSTIQFFILGLLVMSDVVIGQSSPPCQWAYGAAGNDNNDIGNSVSTDANGNVFMTGRFSSSTIVFGTTTLTNSGVGFDIFIVKYSTTGMVLWAKSAGGSGPNSDSGNSVATDSNGNVFVTGYFGGSTIVFGTTTLTSNGGPSGIFIVKYSPTGAVLWAESFGGISYGDATSVSSDANGNAYVVGDFNSPSLTVGTTTLVNTGIGNYDIFIVKYSPTGAVLWANSSGGLNGDFATSGSSDSNGNTFVTGYFNSPSIVFGTTTFTNNPSANNGWTSKLFIVKYSPTGAVLWANEAGGYIGDNASSVSSDLYGNVFLTGEFQASTIAFGTTTLTRSGQIDAFIVKYSSAGTLLWAKAVGGGSDAIGLSVSTDKYGSVLMTGFFSGPSLTIGTTTINCINNTSGWTKDVFIVKYTATGSPMWISYAGGSLDEYGIGICSDVAGNVYLTGMFTSQTFGIGPVTVTNGGNTGKNRTVFIAKFGDTFVGIEESQKYNGEIKIYPNPFTSQTTIEFSDDKKNATIVIWDLMGREIKRISNVGRQNVVIEKGTMESGVYLLQVVDEKNMVLNKRIVIQ